MKAYIIVVAPGQAGNAHKGFQYVCYQLSLYSKNTLYSYVHYRRRKTLAALNKGKQKKKGGGKTQQIHVRAFVLLVGWSASLGKATCSDL